VAVNEIEDEQPGEQLHATVAVAPAAPSPHGDPGSTFRSLQAYHAAKAAAAQRDRRRIDTPDHRQHPADEQQNHRRGAA